jgi:nitroreductase
MTDMPNADSPYADAFRVAPATSDALDGLNMPLQDAMLTQRAVRRVHSEPVDDAVVLKCIELALRAPTGANGQNWEFIVVKDRRVIKKLAGRYRQGHPSGAMAGRPFHRDPGFGGGLPAAHRPRRPCAVFSDAPRSCVGILGIDLPECAEPSIGGARDGSGSVVDHLAAVGRVAGPQDPRPPSLGDTVLCGGSRVAARALRPDYAGTGGAGHPPQQLR